MESCYIGLSVKIHSWNENQVVNNTLKIPLHYSPRTIPWWLCDFGTNLLYIHQADFLPFGGDKLLFLCQMSDEGGWLMQLGGARLTENYLSLNMRITLSTMSCLYPREMWDCVRLGERWLLSSISVSWWSLGRKLVRISLYFPICFLLRNTFHVLFMFIQYCYIQLTQFPLLLTS